MVDERASTVPPVARDFHGLAERMESIHTDQKQFRNEQNHTNQAIDRRVSRLEFLAEQTGERLNGGASTFAKLENQIDKVNSKIEGPVWKTVLKVIGFVAPTVMFVLHLTWYAARMPDEGKFETLQSVVYEQKLELVQLKGTLNTIQVSQQAAAQQASEANKKLDAMLLRQVQSGSGVP